jgi:tetratricopeptide (TPR) repeat protein
MASQLKYYIILQILVLTILGCEGQKKKDAADFFLKANVALSQNNYAEAIRLYDEAIAKNAEFPDAYLNKGITLLKINRVSDAREILTQAIVLDPTLVQANLVRSETALRMGDLVAAEEDLKTIAKIYQDSTRYFLIHGNLMNARGTQSEALADYDRALTLSNKNVEALVNRGAIYYQLKSYELAKKDFTKAAQLNPASPEALNNLGLIATKETNWEQAISYFDLILNSNPAEPLALNNKGFVLLQTGNNTEAKKLIDRSLDIFPANGYALRNLGIYYQKNGEPEKAINEFNKAIEIAEPVEMLYGLTGSLYFQQKNKPKACELWTRGAVLKDSISVSQLAKNCR